MDERGAVKFPHCFVSEIQCFQVDIFLFDVILIPIHSNSHWCLAVIDFKRRSVTYYDSLLGHNTKCLKRLKCVLMIERVKKT